MVRVYESGAISWVRVAEDAGRAGSVTGDVIGWCQMMRSEERAELVEKRNAEGPPEPPTRFDALDAVYASSAGKQQLNLNKEVVPRAPAEAEEDGEHTSFLQLLLAGGEVPARMRL